MLTVKKKKPTRKLDGVDTQNSPYTPLAATDTDTINNVFLFYTSTTNDIKRFTINQQGKEIGPTDIATTTPKGNLAAVIKKTSPSSTVSVEEVIIFYQLANPATIQRSTAARYVNRIHHTKYTITQDESVTKFSEPEFGHLDTSFV